MGEPIDLDDLQRVGVKVRELTDDNWLADMVEIACDEIARLREQRRWVPVGERLPEVGSLVLAFINGEVMEATFCGGGGLAWQTDRGGFNATHWMPLPPGPETQEDDNVPIQK